MADSSYAQCLISKIEELLKENDKFDWVYAGFSGYKQSREIHLRLLKTLVCYAGKWSDEDKAKHLGSLLTAGHLEAQFKHFVNCATLIHFGRRPLPSYEFQDQVSAAYGNLLSVSHPPVSVFSEFAASVKDYLEIFPLKRKSCNKFSIDLSYDVVKRDYTTTARKLESFKCLICKFEERCIDKEKLSCCLARAGALVLSVAHVGCENQTMNRHGWRFPLEMLRGSHDLSQKLSPHNPQVVQIYVHVLGAYLEIIKAVAEKPLSAVALLQSAERRVDILGDILDYPLMDLVVKPEDYNEQVEDWLKLAFAPVVREAGSLTSFIPNIFPSKLLHKLKLIKAEIFVLELHNHKYKLQVSLDNRVATIREVFRFLSIFFKTPEPEAHMEGREKSALVRIKALLREAVGSLCDSHQSQEVAEDVIFKSSLAIFKLFKAQAMLMVLIDNDASLKFLARYQLESLQKSLIVLGALLSDPPNNDYVEDGNFSAFIEGLASQTTSLVCSFGANKMEKFQPVGMNVFPSHLSKKIELNSAEIKAVYQQSPWWLFSHCPKKDGISVLDFPLAEPRKLLTNTSDTFSFMKDQVELLLGELELLRSFLKDVQQQNNEDKERVVCLIHEAEYIINLFVARDVPVWYCGLMLFNAIEETKLIKAQIPEYYHKKETVSNVQPTPVRVTLEASNAGTDEDTVGFDHHAKIIVDQLKNDRKQLQTVSIVGMPGVGKTTLAMKVYNDLSLQRYFMVRAWCYVSQVYQRRELLLDILADFVQVTDEIKRKDDEGIAKTLYQSLKGKRYLIVMDDMWSIEPWSELKSSLPDDGKGSRILFTSRFHDVALHREPYVLPLLPEAESWDLLQKKLFHGGSCPKDLLNVGRLIAENCKGLPLAIVVTAGLLKEIEKTKYRWEVFAERFKSYLGDDSKSRFMDILGFSYYHLPLYLRPCFLYLGMFREDKEVPVQKLIWLWIAEGFIEEMAGRSLEATAEGYLLELNSRSLVMEANGRSRGGIKTCRMHDMVRDLCLKKAKEENFMHLISVKDALNSNPRASVFYRLCVHSPKDQFLQLISMKDTRNSGRQVHSLLFFPTGDSYFWLSYDISCIFENFKFLRVLYLEYMTIDETFPWEIELMLCLQYLALRGNINSVPSSIAKLLNLETLIVKGRRGQIEVPSTLWSMPRLRHVQVHPRAAFALPAQEVDNSMVLDNVATLSSPLFSHKVKAESLLRMLIRLKKLRCIISAYQNNSMFPEMVFLDQLESLKILYHDRFDFPRKFIFPRNLKKLTLSNFRLPWENIVAVRQLPYLEVLKLLSRAFEGPTWDMKEGEFRSLKYLKLANLNLAYWNAFSDHFPQIERLVLQSCKKLGEVPSSIGEIPTLQIIEMHWCSQSATSSVEKIYDQQLEFQNEDFKVLKTHSL